MKSLVCEISGLRPHFLFNHRENRGLACAKLHRGELQITYSMLKLMTLRGKSNGAMLTTGLGLGEATDAAIPKSQVPYPKSQVPYPKSLFIEVKCIIINAISPGKSTQEGPYPVYFTLVFLPHTKSHEISGLNLPTASFPVSLMANRA